MTASAFQPPDEFDGYRLQRLIGRGGNGQVWLARDTLLDRSVAVKFLNAFVPGSSVRERFLLEARAIARLSHPNVVAVFRVGEVDGRPYLVSELVRGHSLDRLATPVEPRLLLRLAAGLAAGLAAAHRRGVLHRDLKPGNALLSEDGEVKLCDFGLAKLVDAGGGPAALDPPDPSSSPSPPSPPSITSDSAEVTPVIADAAPVAARALPSAPVTAPTPPLTDLALTAPGVLVGTPLYMAPELWRYEPATVQSDLYALGAMFFRLASGTSPITAANVVALQAAIKAGAVARPLRQIAPDADPGFAELVDRLLAADPAARPASADEVVAELTVLTSPRPRPPAGNPYRGLRAFDAEHRGLFFGRVAETAAVVERLRAEALVVVAGDSGVGKSSLCQAGVLPLVADGALADGRAWTTARFVPGRRPLVELARALAPVLADGEDALVAALAGEPRALVRRVRATLGDGRGLLVVAEQLEELVTESDADQRGATATALAELADRIPGVRVLASVRSDFLTRVAALPDLGPRVGAGLFLLGPLGGAELREAVTGPARALGVTFESDALVDELVAAAGAPGALPLLSFALAELWDRRDVARRLIPASALATIGGVAGALARHADGVIAALAPAERVAARRVLTQLVTTLGTRAHRDEAELVGDDATAQAALAALVRGRLLAVHQGDDGASAYQVAHEALLTGWGTLAGWLDHDAGRRAVSERLAAAAAEWQRVGRAPAALWGPPQLAEAARVALTADQLAGRDAAFLRASVGEVRRRRWRRRGFIVALPVLAAAVWGATAWKASAARTTAVTRQLALADTHWREGSGLVEEVERRRTTAFTLFDHGKLDDGEAAWRDAQAATAEANLAWARAAQALEAAVAIDPSSAATRDRLADVLDARAGLAALWRMDALERELRDRLRLYDRGGVRAARWQAPGEVHVATSAPAAYRVRPYLRDGARYRLGDVHASGATPARVALPPGSYLVEVQADDRPPIRLPIRLDRAERVAVELDPRVDVPAGMVYVPAGRFLYGSALADDARTDLGAVPEHVRETGAYLIGRHEVTIGEWLEFVDAQPAAQQAALLPSSDELAITGPAGRRTVRLKPSSVAYTAVEGEPIRYGDRARHAEQDWRRFPIAGISVDDVSRYATWLATSGRLPGARLCTELEWERAARGADDRVYPGGFELDPATANFDETYGRRPAAFGPDQVGLHPASDSPFGVADLAGNVWELVEPVNTGEPVVLRGGSFYQARLSASSTNRSPGETSLQLHVVGARICATPR